MPRTGVICDVSGEVLSDEECLACARRFGKQQPPGGGAPRHCNYNYPFINAWLHPYDRSNAGISTTNLTGKCTRKVWYEKIYDFQVSPSKAHASVDGTAYHDFMDKHTEPEAINEVRLLKRWTHDGQHRAITGQMDYYRPDLKLLQDYKVKTEVFTTPPPDYEAQLNIYRWMLETGCIRMDTGELIRGEVEEMYLVPEKHMGQRMVPVPIWPLDQVSLFVNRIVDHYVAAEQGTLPPRGFDPTHPKSILCRDWCPFHKQCIKDGGAIEQPPYYLGKVEDFIL